MDVLQVKSSDRQVRYSTRSTTLLFAAAEMEFELGGQPASREGKRLDDRCGLSVWGKLEFSIIHTRPAIAWVLFGLQHGGVRSPPFSWE